MDQSDATPPPRPPRGRRHPDLLADAIRAAKRMRAAALDAQLRARLDPTLVPPVTSDTATTWLDNRRPGRYGSAAT